VLLISDRLGQASTAIMEKTVGDVLHDMEQRLCTMVKTFKESAEAAARVDNLLASQGREVCLSFFKIEDPKVSKIQQVIRIVDIEQRQAQLLLQRVQREQAEALSTISYMEQAM
jgi:hypothetical protein